MNTHTLTRPEAHRAEVEVGEVKGVDAGCKQCLVDLTAAGNAANHIKSRNSSNSTML